MEGRCGGVVEKRKRMRRDVDSPNIRLVILKSLWTQITRKRNIKELSLNKNAILVSNWDI
jgi:hypothetical protein